MWRKLPCVSHMDKSQLEKEIARLDGFLSGIALMNGKAKDYSAGAFFIELTSEYCSAEDSIKKHYKWLPGLAISNIHHIDRGMRDFESAIRPFLLRNTSHMSSDEIDAMRRHMSFAAMEMISSATSDHYSQAIEVIHMSNANEPLASKCDYFCFRLDDFLIVLQFNDDTEFAPVQTPFYNCPP